MWLVKLILSAYQLALTYTHMHVKMIHMKIIIKFAWKMGSNQYWPGIAISKEISWVCISKILGIYYQHGWELALQTLDHEKTNNYNELQIIIIQIICRNWPTNIWIFITQSCHKTNVLAHIKYHIKYFDYWCNIC